MELTDQEDIARLQQALADLQVREQTADLSGAIHHDATMDTAILFAKEADPNWLCRAAFKSDCTELEIFPLFAQYGAEGRQQLQDTTFLADLNHDGVEEQVVLNPEYGLISAYTEDGMALPVKNGVSGTESHYLCEIDGQDYLLEYHADVLDYSNEPSVLVWYLQEFDKQGNRNVVQQDEIQFSLKSADQNFDA